MRWIHTRAVLHSAAPEASRRAGKRDHIAGDAVFNASYRDAAAFVDD